MNLIIDIALSLAAGLLLIAMTLAPILMFKPETLDPGKGDRMLRDEARELAEENRDSYRDE